MLKLKVISILFLLNLLFGNNTCLSKTTEMEKGNSGNYFGIDVVARPDSSEDPKMVKMSYRYSWNRNGFSIGPKIFTLINTSPSNSEVVNYNYKYFNYNYCYYDSYYNKYYHYYAEEVVDMEATIFEKNKIGLGLSIGFDLSDNVTILAAISGIGKFDTSKSQEYNNFGYDLEVSLQLALGRNIHIQTSLERTNFSPKTNSKNFSPKTNFKKIRTNYYR